MKVIIDGKLYDSQVTPIVVIWDTDEERLDTTKCLCIMERRNTPRFYASFTGGPEVGSRVLDEAKEVYGESQKQPISMTW